MVFRDIFKVTRGTRVILAITLSVALAASSFALFYYRSINRSEDPRILKSRQLLSEFEKTSSDLQISVPFLILDSALTIFRSLPDYEDSFETGVIYNNKCSSLLMKALYDTCIIDHEKAVLLDLSLAFCDTAIIIYEKWIDDWGKLSQPEIEERLKLFMKPDDPSLADNFERIFKRRVKNTIMAQNETPRRLSVSLTNKGTIYRHMLKQDSAFICYREALVLWKENRIARSNMSVLTGGDPVKASIIESLFPPDKNRE
jgi:hypothetical protein